jgi:hypothetical protein
MLPGDEGFASLVIPGTWGLLLGLRGAGVRSAGLLWAEAALVEQPACPLCLSLSLTSDHVSVPPPVCCQVPGLLFVSPASCLRLRLASCLLSQSLVRCLFPLPLSLSPSGFLSAVPAMPLSAVTLSSVSVPVFEWFLWPCALVLPVLPLCLWRLVASPLE